MIENEHEYRSPARMLALVLLWVATCGLAVLAAVARVWVDRREKAPVKPTVDTLAVIHRVLDGDRTGDRLIDRWPDAASVMLEISRLYCIDPYLLPVIARVEGTTEGSHRDRNPFGLSVREKRLGFKDYYYSTRAAAILLAENRGKWETEDGVDAKALAQFWCPKNAIRWARNVGAVYQEAWE